MKAFPVLVAASLCLAALPAVAGEQLSVRLVKATNEGGGSPSGIKDILAVLTRNLAYRNYSLVASATLPLPAEKTVRRLGDYAVECDGKQSSLSIKVVRRGKQVLKTTAVLRSGTPLMVGGFPISGGKLILVFVAR